MPITEVWAGGRGLCFSTTSLVSWGCHYSSRLLVSQVVFFSPLPLFWTVSRVFEKPLCACVFSRVQLLWPCKYSPPGSSVHGILQARIPKWVAMPSSRGSSPPSDQTWISCIAGGFFTTEPPGRPQDPRAVGPKQNKKGKQKKKKQSYKTLRSCDS